MSIPISGSGRDRVAVLSRDEASTDDGTWQSGRLRDSAGRSWRFVARGVGVMPIGADVDMRCHVEPIPAAKRNPYTPHEAEQVVVDECYRVHLPVTEDGVVRFIDGNVAGLGPKRAADIVRALGTSAVALLNEDPALLEAVFPGKVGRDAAYCWRRWFETTWQEHQKAHDLALRLASRGVAYRHARRIMRFFRSADVAEIVLLRRPYRLLEVPGFGWRKADRIARQLGIADYDPERLATAAVIALSEASAEDGHSCLPAVDLARRASELVGSREFGHRGAQAAVEAGRIVDAAGVFYLPQALEAEWCIARQVRRRIATAHVIPADLDARVEAELARQRLSADQRSAVRLALTRGFFVLTGGPGTGKTTTVGSVVACARLLGLRVKVAAPTGKAAARAKKATGEEAETVHRLLGGPPGTPRRQPLDVDLLVVDEASMLSAELAAWLLGSLRADTRVLVVGDADQLPSVDHGAVLRDLLRVPGIPVVRLTEVYRQQLDSGIVQNAYRVLRGEPLEATDDAQLVDVTDRRGHATGADDAWEKDEARRALTRELAALRNAGVDVAADVQVLTPMKQKNHLLGVHSLNHLLQDALNPSGAVGPEIGGGRRVRVGDRVMQMRNDYSLGETGVFNGETGEVTSLGPDLVAVRFDAERHVTVSGYRLLNLQLAWATTIHRSQGSEWPAVVVLMHRSHGAMLTRELLYTALTRAKSRLVIITDDGALARVGDEAATRANVRCTGLPRHLAP